MRQPNERGDRRAVGPQVFWQVFWDAAAARRFANAALVSCLQPASAALPRAAAAIAAGVVNSVAMGAALALAGWPLGGQAAQTLPLPCPSGAGWRLLKQGELPRRAADQSPIGGFSAAHYASGSDLLWLLSDLPRGSISFWTGLAGPQQPGPTRPGQTSQPPPQLLRQLPLASGAAQPLPGAIDAEGLVLLGNQLWVASEGRRSAERPAQLLRFNANTGELIEALALPPDWQPAEGRGLASNGGPESLLLLPAAQGPPGLLLAAEQPLLQDPPRQVRLLGWSWPAGADPQTATPQPRAQGSLLLPADEGWGLTDLMLPEPGRLLALLRRFEAPDRWQVRLALYPLPPPASPTATAPLASWDLLTSGLKPDNWEGLALGPPLADGRPSLLLVSDDNLSPLQANRLALLSPNRTAACPPGR